MNSYGNNHPPEQRRKKLDPFDQDEVIDGTGISDNERRQT